MATLATTATVEKKVAAAVDKEKGREEEREGERGGTTMMVLRRRGAATGSTTTTTSCCDGWCSTMKLVMSPSPCLSPFFFPFFSPPLSPFFSFGCCWVPSHPLWFESDPNSTRGLPILIWLRWVGSGLTAFSIHAIKSNCCPIKGTSVPCHESPYLETLRNVRFYPLFCNSCHETLP